MTLHDHPWRQEYTALMASIEEIQVLMEAEVAGAPMGFLEDSNGILHGILHGILMKFIFHRFS